MVLLCQGGAQWARHATPCEQVELAHLGALPDSEVVFKELSHRPRP